MPAFDRDSQVWWFPPAIAIIIVLGLGAAITLPNLHLNQRWYIPARSDFPRASGQFAELKIGPNGQPQGPFIFHKQGAGDLLLDCEPPPAINTCLNDATRAGQVYDTGTVSVSYFPALYEGQIRNIIVSINADNKQIISQRQSQTRISDTFVVVDGHGSQTRERRSPLLPLDFFIWAGMCLIIAAVIGQQIRLRAKIT